MGLCSRNLLREHNPDLLNTQYIRELSLSSSCTFGHFMAELTRECNALQYKLTSSKD